MNLNLLELAPEYFKCPFCGRWHKCHKYTPPLSYLLGNHFVSWPCTTYYAEFPWIHRTPTTIGPETQLLILGEYKKMRFKIYPPRVCQYSPIDIVIDMDELKEESDKYPTVTANLKLEVQKSNTDFRCKYCECRGWCKLATEDNRRRYYSPPIITLGLAFKKEEFDNRVILDDTRFKYKDYDKLEVGPDYDDPVPRITLYDTAEEELTRRKYGIY